MFEENVYVQKTRNQFSLGNIGSEQQIRRMLGQYNEEEQDTQ